MSDSLSKITDSIKNIDSTDIEKIIEDQGAQKVISEVAEKLPEPVQKIGRIQIPSVFGQSIMKKSDSTLNNGSTQEVKLESNNAIEKVKGCFVNRIGKWQFKCSRSCSRFKC